MSPYPSEHPEAAEYLTQPSGAASAQARLDAAISDADWGGAPPADLLSANQVSRAALRGWTVVTPRAEQPYKVVLEHMGEAATEHPFASVRESEAFIRAMLTPAPPEARHFDREAASKALSRPVTRSAPSAAINGGSRGAGS